MLHLSGRFRAPLLLGRGAALCAVAWAFAAAGPAGAQAAQPDLVSLPIERLLTLEVYSASKFVQKVSEAPSAVSVVTAADIRTFGWRTLGDILGSMRGLYLSNDRNYNYLGARGFLRPGDYNTRFLLLIDGSRNNDGVYDQASVGSEFILDVDLIERVEFAPGPGSSIYGANAFFGVINIVTKRCRDIHGAQAAVETGSFGMRKARATYGMHDAGGAELLLSATAYRSRGPDLYFPEFDAPATNNGTARGLDFDRGESVFLKAALGPFSLRVAHSERRKGMPTASFGQVFNDPRAYTEDIQSAVDLGYRTALAADTDLTSRVFWGRYDYNGDYVYDYPPLTVNRDGSRSRWWGTEVKLVNQSFARHKLVFGAEYQYDYRRDQFNFDIAPFLPLLDEHRTGRRAGVYVQDEIMLRRDLLLNAGMRFDREKTTGGNFNPRIALIHKLTPDTTLKAVYGRAFRAPNAYELYYELLSVGGQKANSALRAERIRTVEFSAEHYLSRDARLTASVFHNHVTDLITQTSDPSDGLLIFRNLNKATARGVEVEFEQAWATDARLRTSYSWQRTRDGQSGATLANSPRHLAKLNLSVPIPGQSWRAGLEAQYIARRQSLRGSAEEYWLANLTLSSVRLSSGWEASASVYNLFDRRYADPGSEEHVQDVIPQNGRTFRLQLGHAF